MALRGLQCRARSKSSGIASLGGALGTQAAGSWRLPQGGWGLHGCRMGCEFFSLGEAVGVGKAVGCRCHL